MSINDLFSRDYYFVWYFNHTVAPGKHILQCLDTNAFLYLLQCFIIHVINILHLVNYMQKNVLCIFVLFSETWFSCLDDDLSIFVQTHIVVIEGFAFNRLSSIHVYLELDRLSQLCLPTLGEAILCWILIPCSMAFLVSRNCNHYQGFQ